MHTPPQHPSHQQTDASAQRASTHLLPPLSQLLSDFALNGSLVILKRLEEVLNLEVRLLLDLHTNTGLNILVLQKLEVLGDVLVVCPDRLG